MKLVHKDLEKGGSGTVVLVPDEPEDMWHAYNLIMEGDSVKASTVRKVNKRYENDTEITSKYEGYRGTESTNFGHEFESNNVKYEKLAKMLNFHYFFLVLAVVL